VPALASDPLGDKAYQHAEKSNAPLVGDTAGELSAMISVTSTGCAFSVNLKNDER
jgi:hypothetical protein